ncbi:MAG: hypothetical protein K9L70_05690 [Thiohalocapsa sp.]|nr:hypothetical protein [Thiohalocapsa sp.]MCF7991717.1 hypothetical protein [Thiohalocapsa sp.]
MTSAPVLHTGRLVLTPSDPGAGIERGRLADALRDAGFIGEPIAGSDDAYTIGEAFLQLIAFTGCAVQLDTTPKTDGKAFAHVVLRGPSAQPQLLFGRNTRPPRCPDCGKPLPEWQALSARWASDPTCSLVCPNCACRAPGWQWDWRQQAAFGRSFVIVEEVFPSEAAPLPALLDVLRGLDAGPWNHFYVQD